MSKDRFEKAAQKAVDNYKRQINELMSELTDSLRKNCQQKSDYVLECDANYYMEKLIKQKIVSISEWDLPKADYDYN